MVYYICKGVIDMCFYSRKYRYYIIDKVSGLLYKRNLTNKEVRKYKRYAKKMGYNVRVGIHTIQ